MPRIARRGIELSGRLVRHRWVVERTMSWLNGCRRLHRRYERKAGRFLAFVGSASILICCRRLNRSGPPWIPEGHGWGARGAVINVLWTATALESGRFSTIERSTDLAGLADHFNALRSGGQGYLEVRLSDSEFPLLTLSFQDDQSIVHLFDDADRSFLLVGDRTAAADSVVHVPITDNLAAFSGGFVSAVDRAWALLCNSVRAGSPGELGEWHEL